ncbi:MAG: amidohydrolase family protein [Pseudomonadota bacterium]
MAAIEKSVPHDDTSVREQPNLPFVDAHHHLWDLAACRYPWLMARGDKRFFGDPTPIQRDYLPADFLGESKRSKPTRSVHIQVGVAIEDEVRETNWLSSLGDFPHAIVASTDLTGPNRDRLLEQHGAFPKVRGIRQILGRHPLEDQKHKSDQLIDNDKFRSGLQELVRRDLSFDLQLIPQQMIRVAELLSDLPALRVALCHCGSPWEQTGEGLRLWQAGLARLAELPNVVCKISGLGMFNPEWSGAAFKPIIHEVIDRFGPQRVMCGSNFPVDKLYASYDRLWDAYKLSLSRYSAEEQRQMLAATATDFYRLD